MSFFRMKDWIAHGESSGHWSLLVIWETNPDKLQVIATRQPSVARLNQKGQAVHYFPHT